MHTSVFPEQPFYRLVFVRYLLEANQCPGVCLKVGWILIITAVHRRHGRQFIPLFTGNLTTPATDTFGYIDKFHFFYHLSHPLSEDIDHEGFAFRNHGIGIADIWREPIGRISESEKFRLFVLCTVRPC